MGNPGQAGDKEASAAAANTFAPHASMSRSTTHIKALPHWPVLAKRLALLAFFLLSGVLTIVLWWLLSRTPDLCISAGMDGEPYHLFSQAFKEVVEKRQVLARLQVHTSSGSVQNMQRVAAGEADLAIVQSDTPVAAAARLLAVLNKESIHIIASKSLPTTATTLADLPAQGLKVYFGPDGGGAAGIMAKVFRFAKVQYQVIDDLPRHDQVGIDLALSDGRIDVACFVRVAPSKLVDRLLQSGHRLLGVESADKKHGVIEALERRYRYLSADVLPLGLYGNPSAARTVSVGALLVARSDLDDALIYRLTAALFDGRSEMAQRPLDPGVHWTIDINEVSSNKAQLIPHHQGARRYYARRGPGFLERHAESVSLFLSALIAIATGVLALYRWFRRRRKDHVDRFYQRVRKLAQRMPGADRDELVTIRQSLRDIKNQAFSELIDEGLEPDASFVILHDLICFELNQLVLYLQAVSPGDAEPV